jgi:predicted NodU family carbamoyl transferase
MELLMTVGNTSSAILVDNGTILCGYEEEKLTRIKADNSFPLMSIMEIGKHYDITEIKKIYRSDDLDYFKKEQRVKNLISTYPFHHLLKEKEAEINKILMPVIRKARSANIKFRDSVEIVKKSTDFTHHDMHKESVKIFSGQKDFHILVIDRVGDKDETLSLYRGDELIHREFGEEKSLGSLFHEACIFCGMKLDIDEGKFQGYMSHINKSRYDRDRIDESIDYLEKFPFDQALKIIVQTEDILERRIITGYIIQKYLERKVSKILKDYKVKNLIAAGGVFYNVALNNYILGKIDGKFSVMPLSGDSGTAIGLYGDIELGNLCFGKRNLRGYEGLVKDRDKFINLIVNNIRNNKIVNIITGNCEFGPRALCHTSTLALPTRENAIRINKMNNRLMLMPMAPVMTEENSTYFFLKDDVNRVIKSDEYMIMAYNYHIEERQKYGGIMHKMEQRYTGRPQIIRDKNHFMNEVLERVEDLTGYKALINTSFNVHGKPICFSINDAISDYKFQKMKENNVVLLIGDF